MIMGGSMATTAVAAICPQKTPVEAKKLMVPTGKVVVLCLLSASGKITLFQLKTKVNIEVTIMPGKASGMMMRKKSGQAVGAIDPGGFLQIKRHLVHEALQQPDGKRNRQRLQGHDHRPIGAGPADARHQDEVGNHEDNRRRDQQADIPVHDKVFAAHGKAGKRIGGRQGKGQAEHGGAAADDHTADQLRGVVAGVDECVFKNCRNRARRIIAAAGCRLRWDGGTREE